MLQRLDLSQKLDKATYERDLAKLERRLALSTRAARFRGISVMAVFEGADAAGKGGAIRRITAALDARYYRVVPIAAPTEEERAQPYLWRFWRHVPRRGTLAIFDPLLVRPRARGARRGASPSEPDWMRAYTEINDFEEQLVQNRTVLVKFWLQVSQEEQLRRFQERERTAFKRFKITPRRLAQPATSGTPTRAPCATWSTGRAPSSPRGRSSRPRTSTTRASRSPHALRRDRPRDALSPGMVEARLSAA